MTSPPRQHFRLYVAGRSANSVIATQNLTAVCREFWPDQHDIEIVDVLQEPGRALQDHILVTPTLLHLFADIKSPQRIVGNLSRRQVVLAALDLPPSPS